MLNRTKLLLLQFSLGFVLYAPFNIVKANELSTISTSNIVQATTSALPNCLRYKVTGICFWLNCDGPYCSVNETLKVDHFLPDAVVSVYRKSDSNPWDYANKILDPVAQKAGEEQVQTIMGFKMGHGNETTASPQDQNAHFKESDVIGNPAIKLFQQLNHLFLPSQATPFMPYYLSMLDAYMWRSPLMEMLLYPLNIIPGVHIVGSLIDNWGSVYPRTGFLNQPADAKAAAVLAQRAIDIATKDYQPHVYKPLNSDSCGVHCEVAAAKENDPDIQWQMVYPKTENQCAMFGKNDLAQPRPWNSDAAQMGDGNYAWVLWRRYHGCIQGEGSYIGEMDY